MNKIMLIKSCNRRENIDLVQKTLTDFGCIIKTRLGLHEAGDACSNEGLIILQLADDADEIKKLEKTLSKIECVDVKTVEI